MCHIQWDLAASSGLQDCFFIYLLKRSCDHQEFVGLIREVKSVQKWIKAL